MTPVPLKDPTRRLGAPEGWNHETEGVCHTLEIADRDGWMISAWMPTRKEIERMLDGDPVFLHVQGTRHPVVVMTVGDGG